MASFIARSALSCSTKLRVPTARASLGRVSVLVNGPKLTRSFSVSSHREVKKYTESHEWVEVPEDGKICTVGITKYASNALGEVVYVELPTVGDKIEAGDAFGSVESVKSASDLNLPVSGKVVQINGEMMDEPSEVSSDPEGDSWLVKVERDEGDLPSNLMNEKEYEKYINNLE
ncbi:glycine cleavage H-protein-domain-containing protein [Xylariales sp. PMI_506]|nr:glycine cleavage H-protein-domain-containing protein [Xylariales sp. PMI_506]